MIVTASYLLFTPERMALESLTSVGIIWFKWDGLSGILFEWQGSIWADFDPLETEDIFHAWEE